MSWINIHSIKRWDFNLKISLDENWLKMVADVSEWVGGKECNINLPAQKKNILCLIINLI